MEPIAHLHNSTKAIEVLYFEEAEVTKMKGTEKLFATFGALSVLYFSDYNRFFLQINDWRYPLLRRLETSSSGNGSYSLPGSNGLTYQLKINTQSGQALNNLDNLLESTRKLEKSPEDKLVMIHHQKDTGLKEVISQRINQMIHKVQNKSASLKTGTKNLTSTKKKVNLKDIKNRNYREEAHSRIKKDFFHSSGELFGEFTKRRERNFNLREPRDMETLRRTTGYDAGVMYLPKEEIEEALLKSKGIFAQSSPKDNTGEKKGLMESLKKGIHDVKDNLRGDSREVVSEVELEKIPASTEGMVHYQG